MVEGQGSKLCPFSFRKYYMRPFAQFKTEGDKHQKAAESASPSSGDKVWPA